MRVSSLRRRQKINLSGGPSSVGRSVGPVPPSCLTPFARGARFVTGINENHSSVVRPYCLDFRVLPPSLLALRGSTQTNLCIYNSPNSLGAENYPQTLWDFSRRGGMKRREVSFNGVGVVPRSR